MPYALRLCIHCWYLEEKGRQGRWPAISCMIHLYKARKHHEVPRYRRHSLHIPGIIPQNYSIPENYLHYFIPQNYCMPENYFQNSGFPSTLFLRSPLLTLAPLLRCRIYSRCRPLTLQAKRDSWFCSSAAASRPPLRPAVVVLGDRTSAFSLLMTAKAQS